MKKLLSLLSIFSFSCGSTMTLISCSNIANKKPHLPPSKPKESIIKYVFYYEKLKQEITTEIKEYDEVINEIKNSEDDYENITDYQIELKQTQAEKFIKMSELNSCKYHILLYQKESEFINEQKQQVINLLENQINKHQTPNSNNPNGNNESGWGKFFKKPVNLFFMTLISCGIFGGFITWIILKNQFNKKWG